MCIYTYACKYIYVYMYVYVFIDAYTWLSVKTLGYGSGPGTPFDPYPDPYPMDYGLVPIHTPRSIPLICEQAQDELAKAQKFFLTLTDHLPCRAGFSYAKNYYYYYYYYYCYYYY